MLYEPAISVSVRYFPKDQKIWARLLVGRETFPFTSYGSHPASYPMGTAEPSLGGKATETLYADKSLARPGRKQATATKL